MTNAGRKVAVIGSFRRFYTEVLEAIAAFSAAGLAVTSPAGAALTQGGAFVRFASDRADWSNSQVQTAALAKIFEAEIAFVVAPGGYVGRSTCYEIGRLYQARRPVIFSAAPDDLPVAVPPAHVMAASDLARRLATGEIFSWVHNGSDEFDALEQALTGPDMFR
ncbi:MAG TPA: hypothetical protein VII56_23195 [Rhizomicrobium sp.]